MKVVSSVGAKGGSGKSSISLILAWELAKRHKAKVVLVDSDVQGTCISAKALNSQIPFEVVSITDKNKLCEHGKKFEEDGVDFLIIDANPRSIHEDPAFIEMIAKNSDLNLIVSRPSPRDLKAQIQFVEMVKRMTKGEIRLLWNFFQKNTAAHKEGVPEGERLLGLKSLQTRIGLRVVYQDVGYSEAHVGDLGNEEAADEIKRLGIEVKGILHGKN